MAGPGLIAGPVSSWAQGWLPGNALVALLAAAAWGGGDFAGGMGVKAAGGSTRGALRLVLLAHSLSLFVLLCILLLRGAPPLRGAPLVWGVAGGVAAGLSLTAFYIALASGAMGASAAVSGLLAAAIPVAVSTVLEGAPNRLQIAGFLLAGAAIWVIAVGSPKEAGAGRSGTKVMALAIFGGIGFGLYFVALRLANPLGVFAPMALARTGSLLACGAVLLALMQGRQRAKEPKLHRAVWLWAGGVALLDTGGNLLFLLATRMGRLDVAAVLASLYPASTILLAAWRLHERPTRRQLAGMVLALAAVVMVTV